MKQFIFRGIAAAILLFACVSMQASTALCPFGQMSLQPWQAKYYHQYYYNSDPTNWYAADFNDSEWQTISGPISTANGLPYYATSWGDNYYGYYLRRHFPTTLNDELAGCLGVSPRTLVRKTRELGLQKDPQWLSQVWEERRLMAQSASRRSPNSTRFKKGIHYNPAGEFGNRPPLTEEQRKRRIEGVKRWCRMNPGQVKDRAAKVWATRRAQSSPGAI